MPCVRLPFKPLMVAGTTALPGRDHHMAFDQPAAALIDKSGAFDQSSRSRGA
jgi:hypothetical protein